MPRITIVGTGLIGTSIGLGLKKVGTKAEIVGHDKDRQAATRAQKAGAVDKADWNLPSSLDGASLVIIATPLAGVRQTLEIIARDAPAGCIVTDTASVKVPVLAWADELLPAHMSFVGGHPLVRQQPGAEGAHADLFDNMPYCLCPSARADEDAVRMVTDLVGGLGARCLFIDAAEHDGLAGGANHLPVVIAAALTEMLATQGAWRDLGQFATSEFELGTRLAAGANEADSQALLLANRENIVRWIDEYVPLLQLWRERLTAGDEESLTAVLRAVRETRERWLRGEVEETPDFIPRYGLGGAMKHAFFGSLFQQDEDQEKKK
jgi:prephenate dehydrogenase